MSADIINLRQARKHKARAEAETRAAQNRVSSGLSKSERKASKVDRDSASRKLDGHQMSPPKPDDG